MTVTVLKSHLVKAVCALAEVRATMARAATRREDLRWFIFWFSSVVKIQAQVRGSPSDDCVTVEDCIFN